MTRVVWVGERRLCWDQHLVDACLPDGIWEHETAPMPHDDGALRLNSRGGGAIVIVPAKYVKPWHVNHMVENLRWCVVVLTSDEESTFDHRALEHPNMRVWTMTPRPGQHEPGLRYLGEGCAELAALDSIEQLPPRSIHVQFAGQVTHQRRVDMIDALNAMAESWPEGRIVRTLTTQGFLQGMPRLDYLDQLAFSRVVLAPSGPATPDSFRAYEALEAGAVPIVDGRCPGYDADGYWSLVYPAGVPFPVVHDWHDELAKTVDHVLANWQPMATRCQAWWLQQKRALRCRLEDDVHDVRGVPQHDPASEITVLVSTSPTSQTPQDALAMISTTIESVRDRLPDAEIIVTCDGVRDEQQHLRDGYETFLQMLTWRCARRWQRVWPLIIDHHAHQANATRAALEFVRSPLVMFVEHDTPLCGEIPFSALASLVRSGAANVVRLHHEANVLQPHQHLMLDRTPWPAADVPVLRTVQWSQRPHLASAGFYRQMLGSYFGTQSRTMIEDVLHGVVQSAWHRHGEAGWEQFRLVMYAPEGDMKRSLHLDGRGPDPKYDMIYAYDGPKPDGAPAPTMP